MNRPASLSADDEARLANPPPYSYEHVGLGDYVSRACPDCNAPPSYRIIDEDTGCSYPVDDGEHYCAGCASIWTDEEPTWDEFAAPFRRLAKGWNRVEL